MFQIGHRRFPLLRIILHKSVGFRADFLVSVALITSFGAS
jgi:hypothetical protein